MSQAGGTTLSSQIPGFEMGKDSGIDEAQLIPVNVDSEDPEVAAAQAFKVLAKILQEAREKKRKQIQEEMDLAAQKEQLDVFNAEIKPIIKEDEQTKRWIIYPDTLIRSLWDLLMTL